MTGGELFQPAAGFDDPHRDQTPGQAKDVLVIGQIGINADAVGVEQKGASSPETEHGQRPPATIDLVLPETVTDIHGAAVGIGKFSEERVAHAHGNTAHDHSIRRQVTAHGLEKATADFDARTIGVPEKGLPALEVLAPEINLAGVDSPLA